MSYVKRKRGLFPVDEPLEREGEKEKKGNLSREAQFYLWLLVGLCIALFISGIVSNARASECQLFQEETACRDEGGLDSEAVGFYTIRLACLEDEGCYVYFDDDPIPIFLKEDELPEMFWVVGVKEQYHNRRLPLSDPVVQQIIEKLEEKARNNPNG